MKKFILTSATFTFLLLLGTNCRTTQLAVPLDNHKFHKLISKSVKRKFQYYLPPVKADYQYSKMPVVIALHGGGGNANNMIIATKLSDYAMEQGFIAVYPSGIGNRWNDGRKIKTSLADRQRIDDIQFLKDIKKFLVENHNADPDNFYLTGFSNGGFMVTRTICDTKDLFAGYAALGAGISKPHFVRCLQPDKKPILFIWGEEDETVPFNGGEMIVKSEQNLISVGFTESYDTTVSHFAQKFDCKKTNVTSLKGKKNRSPSAIQKRVHDSCEPRGYVEGYALKHHIHTWPGGFVYRSSIDYGYDGDDLNASDVVVEFFKKNWLRSRDQKETKSLAENRLSR